MADPNTLKDFITRSIEAYPADDVSNSLLVNVYKPMLADQLHMDHLIPMGPDIVRHEQSFTPGGSISVLCAFVLSLSVYSVLHFAEILLFSVVGDCR
jgi:hypothetical protein